MKIEEATRKTAEYLGCTAEQLNNAINHFKKIDEAEANKPNEKIDEIIGFLKHSLIEELEGDTEFKSTLIDLKTLLERLEKFKEEEL